MAATTIEGALAQAGRDMDAGDWPAARAGFGAVLALDPANADAMLQLSYVESLAGRHRAANGWAVRAAASDALPASPASMLEMVRRLRTFNEVPALRAFAERLAGLPRPPHRVLVEAASQLGILNDFHAALRFAGLALRLEPGDPAARLVHAQLLAHFGRVEEATSEFERVLRERPGIANAWWMLSRLRRQTPAGNHVRQLQSLLRAPGLTAADAASLARALHKELDDLGEYEGAWQALELMCRARRSSLQYDPREIGAVVDGLFAWTHGRPPAAPPVAASATAGASGAAVGAPVPVFVVGMHRSGTTLLEQLLDASPQVRALGELVDFAAAMRFATDHYCKAALDSAMVQRAASVDFAEVGRRYLAGLGWRLGDEPFFTDKQPANFLHVGFICHALPQARILHLVRDPMETCFSNLRELYSGINEHSYDQRDLAGYFLQYRRLMAHWHAVFPGRILDVPYAGLVADTEATMRSVAAHCGIGYVPGMRDPRSSARVVSTASSVQVRDAVVRRETPKWLPYARHLQPLAEALRAGGVELPGDPA